MTRLTAGIEKIRHVRHSQRSIKQVIAVTYPDAAHSEPRFFENAEMCVYPNEAITSGSDYAGEYNFPRDH
jgi:hypothetical protein